MKQTRNTTAKAHIQDILINSGHALSQVEIQDRSVGVCDRVTIYRVLDRLVEEGVVHKTVQLDGVVKFAFCKTCEHGHYHNHGHIHFHCEKCGEVTCLENIVPEIKLPRSYSVKESNFTLSGTCPKCK